MIDSSLIFDGTFNSAAGTATGVALTTTTVSTNILDLLVARDIGAGNDIEMHVQVLTAFAGGTSLQVGLQVCATTNGTYLGLILSPVAPTAQLIVGAPIFRYTLPVNQILNATAGILKAPGRYLQLAYTIVGTYTLGTVFSYLSADKDRNVYYTYPNNYTANIYSGEI